MEILCHTQQTAGTCFSQWFPTALFGFKHYCCSQGTGSYVLPIPPSFHQPGCMKKAKMESKCFPDINFLHKQFCFSEVLASIHRHPNRQNWEWNEKWPHLSSDLQNSEKFRLNNLKSILYHVHWKKIIYLVNNLFLLYLLEAYCFHSRSLPM